MADLNLIQLAIVALALVLGSVAGQFAMGWNRA
jgi:hypothetical protein